MPTLASVIRRLGLGLAAFTCATGICAVVSSPLARANEPTTLRVVSVTRATDGHATIVVSVPNRFVATATAGGAFTVVTSDGTAVAPAVTPLPSSTAAVAVVVDVADGSTADGAARVTGAAAELVRSLDPGVSVAVITTRDTTKPTAPTTDRAASLATLAAGSGPVTQSVADAVNAAGALLGVAPYVDPLVVVFDSATTTAVTTPTYAAGIGLQRISVGGAADPVSLVDDTVGLMQGRFLLTAPGAGAGPLAVRLSTPAGPLDATIPGAAPPPSTTAATVADTRVAAPVPSVAPTSTPLVAPGTVAQTDRSPVFWIALLVGLAALVLVVAALWARRRRQRAERAPGGPPPAADQAKSAPPAVPGLDTPRARRVVFSFTDFTAPPGTSRTGTVAVSRPNGSEPPPASEPAPAPASEPAPAPAPAQPAAAPVSSSAADETYAKRLRVLALADELGNISEACRIVGVSRRSFYEWKRIAEEKGNDALYPKRVR
jgi:hypothetical protein